PPLSIANKLLAEVPNGAEPEALARAARAAVLKFWRVEIAAPVKDRCANLLATGVAPVWDEQIETFVEFSATWAPLDDYETARRSAERAIAARKNLRDFAQWRQFRGGVPKSSLDGARETILRPGAERPAAMASKYRIGTGEQLDAVGLVKRAGGEPEQFVPIVNVALASWTAQASGIAPREFAKLQVACSDLQLARVSRSDLPCGGVFPFDASVLVRSRWRTVFDEQKLSGDAKSWGHDHVDPLLAKLSDPYPYVACLVADGDHMGRAIDTLTSAQAHRALSNELSGFASHAREVVEQSHRGVLVYSGGDDVLAFLPLPEALDCANDLRSAFVQAMAACGDFPTEQRPTLSVGIGVGHFMESMGDLLALGRDAEAIAKNGKGFGHDRNALAIVVDKRSGGAREWRSGWDEWGGDPVARLREDARLIDVGSLSTGKIYEIARVLARLPKPTSLPVSGWEVVLVREVHRSLSRIRGDAAIDPNQVGLALKSTGGYAALHAAVSSWVDRMLIARIFAAAEPRARAGKGEAVA
ncbi:MAG: type III-B CRISPR-associated protein Cas10/Cmr2, partial [Vulcanimicrobiaceae bacterium]